MSILSANLDSIARRLHARVVQQGLRPGREFLTSIARRLLTTESVEPIQSAYDRLTPREQQLVTLHREGLNPVEIAARVNSTRDEIVKELAHAYALVGLDITR